MSQIAFNGTGVALVTPFKNGQADYPTLEGLINYVIDGGVDYLVSLVGECCVSNSWQNWNDAQGRRTKKLGEAAASFIKQDTLKDVEILKPQIHKPPKLATFVVVIRPRSYLNLEMFSCGKKRRRTLTTHNDSNNQVLK